MRTFSMVLIFSLALAMIACGGGSVPLQQSLNAASPQQTPSPGASPGVSVVVAPAAVSLPAGEGRSFVATVGGSDNTTVTWSVLEGAAGGTISAAGGYLAPQSPGTYHVVATSQADPSKSATAVVTVTSLSGIFVTVTPISISRFAGESGTFVFTAAVTGTSNTAVTWSVVEGAVGGSIDSAGAYTAAHTPGTYYVQATSVADPTKYAFAEVTVDPVPPNASVSISPAAIGVHPNGVQSFAAAVANANYTGVNWNVQEGPAGGTIISTGMDTATYTAAAVPGTYHVIATYALDGSKFATATVMVTTSGFTATGNMAADHGGHTTTLLPDGRVLVACGFDGSGMAVAEAELFDATNGTFTGFPATAREDCAATSLPNGDVLVAGGWSGDIDVPDETATAEIYDPAGGFSPTGSLVHARYGHTATLLAGGKVLIAGGGLYGQPPYPEAEIYDPGTGTFAPTGTMITPRFGHTATLLLSGKVLIAGGFGNEGGEIYDPASGTFSPVGPMRVPRYWHTATLLPSGKVLIAGGMVAAGVWVTDTEIYDPSTGTFSASGAMVTPRARPTATLLQDGTVLITGGATEDTDWSSSVEIYNPSTGTLFADVPMVHGRWFHSAVRLSDGSVLVTGGYEDMYTAEIYK